MSTPGSHKHIISVLTKLDVHTHDNPGEWQGKEETYVPVITINADNTMLVQVKSAAWPLEPASSARHALSACSA